MPSDPNLPSDHEPTPLPPGSSTPPVMGSPATDTGLAPHVAAGVAILAPLVGGIVFIFLEKRNAFVRFWALQSIVFGGAWFAFNIVSAIVGTILSFIFLGKLWFLVAWLVNVAITFVWLFAVFNAFLGKSWEIPVVGKLTRQQAGRISPL